MNATKSRRLEAGTLGRPVRTWKLGHPISTVSVDLSGKGQIRDILRIFEARPFGMSPKDLENIVAKEWVVEKWNLLALAIQCSYESHPDAPAILHHVERIGGFPWKQDPF